MVVTIWKLDHEFDVILIWVSTIQNNNLMMLIEGMIILVILSKIVLSQPMISVQLMQHFQSTHELTVVEHIGFGLTSNVFLAQDPHHKLHAIKVYDFSNHQHAQQVGNSHDNNTHPSTSIMANIDTNNSTTTMNKLIIDKNTRLHWQYQIQHTTLAYIHHHHQQQHNIIQYQKHGQFKQFGYIIMEHVRDSLYTLICANQRQSEQSSAASVKDNARHIMAQLLRALAGLQGFGIIHRDVKLENILLTHDHTLKLIDFGTLQLHHIHRGQQQHGQQQPDEQWANIVKLDGLLNTQDYLVGTKCYLCPELISGKRARHISPKIDIWSFGIILYRVLCGSFPFTQAQGENNSRYYSKIRTQQPYYPSSLSEDERELIESCLIKDPQKRPSASELLKYKYFTGIQPVINKPSAKSVDKIDEFKCIYFRRKNIKKVTIDPDQVDEDKKTEPNNGEQESQQLEVSTKNENKTRQCTSERHRDANIQIWNKGSKILRVIGKQNKKLLIQVPVQVMKISKLDNKTVKITRMDIEDEYYTLEFSDYQLVEQFIAALMAYT